MSKEGIAGFKRGKEIGFQEGSQTADIVWKQEIKERIAELEEIANNNARGLANREEAVTRMVELKRLLEGEK